MKYVSILLILSFSFLCCKKNNSEIQYLQKYNIPKEMQKDIPKRIHQLIKSKSLHLIDSVLVKTSVLEEIEFGRTYSNGELGYYNTYKIDTTHYKIVNIKFD